MHEDVVKQRDQYYMELESLRRNATPRPEWYKCAEFIYGGLPRWQEMSVGKSSDEMLQILLQEMTGGDAESGIEGKASEDDEGTETSDGSALMHEAAKAFASLILLIIRVLGVRRTISLEDKSETTCTDENFDLSLLFRKSLKEAVLGEDTLISLNSDNVLLQPPGYLESLTERFLFTKKKQLSH